VHASFNLGVYDFVARKLLGCPLCSFGAPFMNNTMSTP
jgi:hypothetical protein